MIFKKTNTWLTSTGICVHTVNFNDHFANRGIFQDKSISEFNFLKYSDKFWNFWSGNAIAYTIRLSHVYYFEKCQIHNLEIVNFIGENYRPRIELKTNLIHKDIILKYGGNVELEELTQYQRGTFVIKKIC